MKKFISLFLTLLTLSVGQMWCASPSTLTFSAACGGSGTADDNVAWTVSSDASESNFDNTKGIHYGTGSAAVSYVRLVTSGIEGTITKVVVKAAGASSTKGKVSVQVGTTDFEIENTDDTEASITSSAADYTFVGSATGTITVSLTQSSTKCALYCKSIAVTYSPKATVTYNANGATTGNVPTDNTEYNPNATVTVLGNTGNLERTGCTFAGWNTKADGTGTSYAADATFSISANTTLYAKWTATVTWKANNVIVKTDDIVVPAAGKTVTLP